MRRFFARGAIVLSLLLVARGVFIGGQIYASSTNDEYVESLEGRELSLKDRQEIAKILRTLLDEERIVNKGRIRNDDDISDTLAKHFRFHAMVNGSPITVTLESEGKTLVEVGANEDKKIVEVISKLVAAAVNQLETRSTMANIDMGSGGTRYVIFFDKKAMNSVKGMVFRHGKKSADCVGIEFYVSNSSGNSVVTTIFPRCGRRNRALEQYYPSQLFPERKKPESKSGKSKGEKEIKQDREQAEEARDLDQETGNALNESSSNGKDYAEKSPADYMMDEIEKELIDNVTVNDENYNIQITRVLEILRDRIQGIAENDQDRALNIASNIMKIIQKYSGEKSELHRIKRIIENLSPKCESTRDDEICLKNPLAYMISLRSGDDIEDIITHDSYKGILNGTRKYDLSEFKSRSDTLGRAATFTHNQRSVAVIQYVGSLLHETLGDDVFFRMSNGSTYTVDKRVYNNQCSILALDLSPNQEARVTDEVRAKIDGDGGILANSDLWEELADIANQQIEIYELTGDYVIRTVHGTTHSQNGVRRLILQGNHYEPLLTEEQARGWIDHH